jgi:hypothetical protein
MPLLGVHWRKDVTDVTLWPKMISASGADSISRVIHVQPDLSDNDFEIQRTVNEIIKGDYKRVNIF